MAKNMGPRARGAGPERTAPTDRLDAGGHEGRNGRSMTITLLHAVLAIVLAATAVVALAAISKIEEPGSTSAHRE